MEDLLGDLDAIGVAAAIGAGTVSAREVVEHALRLIDERNALVNAVAETRSEAALAEVDAGLPDGPLTGVPFVVKDLRVGVAGMVNANGSRLLAGRRAEHDSEIVARYRRAGLVVVATTRTPEFGLSPSTEPTLGGAVRNPHRLSRSAGGSSGGTAAAVVSGMVPAGHGNDGGGSIRIPASACGLVGLKPTRGRTPAFPRRTTLAYPLGVNHALTRTVRDCALLLDVAAGPVPGEPFAAPPRAGRYVDAASAEPPRCRVAMSAVRPDGTPAHRDCAAAAEAAARLLASLGHDVVEATPRYPADAIATAMRVFMSGPLAVEVDTRLAELGRGLADDDLEPFTRVMYDLGKQLSGTDVVVALQETERAGHEMARFFEDHDVLVTPTLAEPVPALGVLDTREVDSMYRHAGVYAAFTSFCNVTGQPAMSLPLGHDADGMPVGVQLVASFGREDLLLQLGAQLEAACPWSIAPVWPPRR
jgi:amidase